MNPDPITDAYLKLRAACTEDCRMYYARQHVKLRFERGDFPIQVMDAALLEVLAKKFVEEVCGG